MLALFREGWNQPPARAAMSELLNPEASEMERSVPLHYMSVSGDGASVAGFFEAAAQIDA